MCISICHIRKKHTRYVNYGDLMNLATKPAAVRGGIYIDIFSLDDAPNNPLLRRVYGGLRLRCRAYELYSYGAKY